MDFRQLKRNLKKDVSYLPVVKSALLGDSATQFLSQAIIGAAIEKGFNINLFEADYNQIERQLLDPSSELYQFNPEYVIIFQSSHHLLELHAKMQPEERTGLADQRIDFIKEIANSPILSGKKIIYFNYYEIDDKVFGNYANKIESSFIYQLRKLNFSLMQLASEIPNLFIADIAAIESKYGRDFIFSPNIYTTTDVILSLDVLPIVAFNVVDIIQAIRGTFKKCLIVDLDNTIWGGIIGDDGLEGIQLGHGLGIGKSFSEFQLWIKKLKQRGIIICVASKNNEETAKDPFLRHPEMEISLDDIAVFQANWDSKVDNIRTIQSILNISFDSMVFLDDNPFERNIVRENIPGISVPELPEDPALYLEYIYSLNLFETASTSGEDSKRTKQYQTEAKRVSVSKTFKNEDDFLKSLDMKSIAREFSKFDIPRIAQLSQRSNQFNLRTVRYTEEQVNNIADNHDIIGLSFTLEDKFGDNGLICVVVLKPVNRTDLFIENWFMSCRVLKRGMEKFVLNFIVEIAKQRGYKRILGEYIPSKKNQLVENHYPSLGFKTENISKEHSNFYLLVSDFIPLKNNITRK